MTLDYCGFLEDLKRFILNIDICILEYLKTNQVYCTSYECVQLVFYPTISVIVIICNTHTYCNIYQTTLYLTLSSF